jgi:hypothetical protein
MEAHASSDGGLKCRATYHFSIFARIAMNSKARCPDHQGANSAEFVGLHASKRRDGVENRPQ